MASNAAARTTQEVNRTRTMIALVIIAVGIVGITAISWIAIGYADNGSRAEVTRLVFGSVLPLFGTWVGSVLAFYFSRDNLQAASQTTLDAVQSARAQVSGDAPATAAMIPYERISPLREVNDLAAAKALELRDLATAMQTAGNARIPIFDQARSILLVVHQPDIDRYCQVSGTSVALLATQTVAQLLDDPPTAAEVQGFVAVPGSATLAGARRELGKKPAAKDIFVTDTGTLAGRVQGWITNSDLARAL